MAQHTESTLYMLAVMNVAGFGTCLKFLKIQSNFGTIPLGGRGREVVSTRRPHVQTSSFVSPGTRDFVACNHLRSYKYYSESILNPDGFTAFPCNSYKTFKSVSYCPAYFHCGTLGKLCLEFIVAYHQVLIIP